MGGFFIPLSTIVGLQARFSKQRIDPAQVRVALDAERPSAMRVLDNGVPFTQIQMPLQATDIPEGFNARIIGTSMRIEAADGTVWPSRQYPGSGFAMTESPTWTDGIHAQGLLPASERSAGTDSRNRLRHFVRKPPDVASAKRINAHARRRLCLMRTSFGPPRLECRALFRSPSSLILLPAPFRREPAFLFAVPSRIRHQPRWLFRVLHCFAGHDGASLIGHRRATGLYSARF